MSQTTKAVSFEEFLGASTRLAQRPGGKTASTPAEPSTSSTKDQSPSSPPQKPMREKVGLSIDSRIVDAIDDYIYLPRKQGRRLKKNDVYETALRQFLGLEGDER